MARLQMLYQSDDNLHAISWLLNANRYNSYLASTAIDFQNVGTGIANALKGVARNNTNFNTLRLLNDRGSIVREQSFTPVVGTFAVGAASASATIGIGYFAVAASQTSRSSTQTIKLYVGHSGYHTNKRKRILASEEPSIATMLADLADEVNMYTKAGTVANLKNYCTVQFNSHAQQKLGS